MSSFYGLDIIRAYEVSWLNSSGKPEIALLEVFQDGIKPDINTWKLKKFLEETTSANFNDFKAVRTALFNFLHADPNFGDSYIKLTTQQDFFSIDFTKVPKPMDYPHRFSHGLRYICDQSLQPNIGTATIYTAEPSTTAHDQLIRTLTELRNSKFTPRTYTVELFNRHFAQTLEEDFVLTIHLNRRGGLSFQSLRCRNSVDFAEYIHREVLE